mgnify:FL=1
MSLTNYQIKLLSLLEKHNRFQKNPLYKPGPYWDYKTKKILYWLKKKGLNDFRGLDSGVGTSYTDNVVVDIRKEIGSKGRMIGSFFSLPFFKRIFNEQLKITKDLVLDNLERKNKNFNKLEKVISLANKYKIENSVSHGCVQKTKINNKEYSILYLQLIERIENLSSIYNFNQINSIIEIGGGFGVNIHLLIQNFKNIKKIIYTDIFPNIFVGTEYLRSLYKDAVRDYSSISELKEIKFSDNDDLEIICIPSWSLEKIKSKVDKFHNAASFQEMTIAQVANYKFLLDKILNKDLISLLVYKGWEKNNSLSADQINKIYNNKLKKIEFSIINQSEKLIYLYA